MTTDFTALASFGFLENSAPGLSLCELVSVGDGAINCKLSSIPGDADMDVVRPVYRRRGGDGSWSNGDDISSPTVGSTFALTGLSNGVEYDVSVISIDTAGNQSPVGNVLRLTPTDGIEDEEMSDLETNIQSDMDTIVLAGVGSRIITYIDQYSESKTIRALVDRSAFSPELTEDGSAEIIRALVSISRDPTVGIEEPDYKDKVRFNDQDWKIEAIDPADMGGLHQITVFRRQRIKMSNSDLSIEEF